MSGETEDDKCAQHGCRKVERSSDGDGSRDGEGDSLLEIHQLVFDRWQPVYAGTRGGTKTAVLHIPVNDTWQRADYRLQVTPPPPPFWGGHIRCVTYFAFPNPNPKTSLR